MMLPAVASLEIDEVSGSGISRLRSGITNGQVIERSNGRKALTQRPAFDVFVDASASTTDQRGRGIFYWNRIPDRYFVNNGTVYRGSYETPMTQSPASSFKQGKGRVWFAEHSLAGGASTLFVLDPENTGAIDQGAYTIDSATPNTITAVADADFPGRTLKLAAGVVVLDGYVFVASEDGRVWNSVLNAPTSWNSEFISASRFSDGLVAILSIGNHIYCLGNNSIEALYDAGNAVGSPLARREDVSFIYGCYDANTIYQEGEQVWFVGVYPTGGLSVFMLTHGKIVDIATQEVASFLSQAALNESAALRGSGLTAGGKTFYVLTVSNLVGASPNETVSGVVSLVWDGMTWVKWDFPVNGFTSFPLSDMAWRSSKAVRGEGIFFNGNIVRVLDDLTTQDYMLGFSYVVSGYVDVGYVAGTYGGTSAMIPMSARTGFHDFASPETPMPMWKFMSELELLMDRTVFAGTATIGLYDQNAVSADVSYTVTTERRHKLTRLGRFDRRMIEVSVALAERVRIEGFDIQITGGSS